MVLAVSQLNDFDKDKDAMSDKRFRRIMNILAQLRARQTCTVETLVRQLDVDRRTIFRDIRTLRCAGVPLEYSRRIDSYQVAPSYFLPPLDMSVEEVCELQDLIHSNNRPETPAAKSLKRKVQSHAKIAGSLMRADSR